MRKLILAGVLCLVSGAALAQQVGAPAPAKDRKDFLIESLLSQTNDGSAKIAVCYADANVKINELAAQLAQAKADLEKATAAATPPPAK